MIFLWNPTSEDMQFSYGGLSYTLNAGKRMKVEEAMGRHVLNNLTSRGMSRLFFDDDGKSINEEQIAKDAVERNRDFKIRQVVNYNERNERRKASGQPYDVPTKEVKKYAIELGLQLLQPYVMAEGEKGQIGKLTKENEELKLQMSNLVTQMQNMMQQVANLGQVDIKKKDEPVKCGMCGEMIMASKMRLHIARHHNIKKDLENDAEPIPI